MTFFSKMQMAPKLGLGFGSVLLLVIVLGGFSILELSHVNSNTVEIATDWLPSVRTAASLRFNCAAVRRSELNYTINPDRKDRRHSGKYDWRRQRHRRDSRSDRPDQPDLDHHRHRG